MPDTITRIAHEGYSVLELNKVAFRRTGRIEAQCALDSTQFSKDVPAENGMLLVVDPVAHKVKLPAAATDSVLLNYTSEHVYDERQVGLRNYCTIPGEILPRLGYLEKGDIFTTNCVSFAKGDTFAAESDFWEAVDECAETPMYGCPHTDGSINVSTSATNAVVQVICGTTLPDGQKAIKFYTL